MYPKALWKRRNPYTFVVAPAGASTWAVAFSRRLIPGALFSTKQAALHYASLLAQAAGVRPPNVVILGAV